MLKRNQEGDLLVSDKDLIIAIQHAQKNNDEIEKKLTNIFSNVEDIVMINLMSYHVIDNESIKNYLIYEAKIKDYQTYIDHNVLKEGYVISKYENNHEMNKKIHGYLIRYLNNEILGYSNEIVEAEIINDRRLLNYLKKYESLDDFITKKIAEEINEITETNVKEKTKTII